MACQFIVVAVFILSIVLNDVSGYPDLSGIRANGRHLVNHLNQTLNLRVRQHVCCIIRWIYTLCA